MCLKIITMQILVLLLVIYIPALATCLNIQSNSEGVRPWLCPLEVHSMSSALKHKHFSNITKHIHYLTEPLFSSVTEWFIIFLLQSFSSWMQLSVKNRCRGNKNIMCTRKDNHRIVELKTCWSSAASRMLLVRKRPQ